MIGIRTLVGLLAAAVVAAAAHAQPAAKSAKSTVDIKRDAKEGWSEVQRTGREIKSGVPAAGRSARDQFKMHGNKAKEGFTGSPPPTIPKPSE